MAAAAAAGLVAVPARGQSPVPRSVMEGQVATPKPPPPPPEVQARNQLAQLHHAARREVDLGELAIIHGATPEVKQYGGDLAARFRAFDRRVAVAAAARGVDEDALVALMANADVVGLRREADNMARLGAASGADFDRAFWLAVADEQSADADLTAAMSTAADPMVRELAVALAPELEHASRAALGAARVETPPASR
jgi:hypothetical protein